MNTNKTIFSKEQLKSTAISQLKKFHKLPKSDPALLSNYKSLITFCNSAAILFFETESFEDANSVLQTAEHALKSYLRIGNHIDKLWQGRILTLNNQGYLNYRTHHYEECLRSLYEALSVILSIKDTLGNPSKDIILTTNLLTFMCLWKLQEYKESREYLEISTETINSILQEKSPSKIPSKALTNLYGLVVMSLAGLTIKIEKNYKKASELCKESLEKLQTEGLSVKNLTSDFLMQISEEDFMESLDIYEGPFLKKEILITKKYEDLIFESLFPCFVAPNQLLRNSPIRLGKRIRSQAEKESSSYWWKNPKFIETNLRSSSGGRWTTPEPEKKGTTKKTKRQTARRNLPKDFIKKKQLSPKMATPPYYQANPIRRASMQIEPILVELSGETESHLSKRSHLSVKFKPIYTRNY